MRVDPSLMAEALRLIYDAKFGGSPATAFRVSRKNYRAWANATRLTSAYLDEVGSNLLETGFRQYEEGEFIVIAMAADIATLWKPSPAFGRSAVAAAKRGLDKIIYKPARKKGAYRLKEPVRYDDCTGTVGASDGQFDIYRENDHFIVHDVKKDVEIWFRMSEFLEFSVAVLNAAVGNGSDLNIQLEDCDGEDTGVQELRVEFNGLESGFSLSGFISGDSQKDPVKYEHYIDHTDFTSWASSLGHALATAYPEYKSLEFHYEMLRLGHVVNRYP